MFQMTIFFSNPAITAVLSWLIQREPLGLVSCAGIAASLGGVTLVTQPPFLFGGHDTWDHTRFIGGVQSLYYCCLEGVFFCVNVEVVFFRVNVEDLFFRASDQFKLKCITRYASQSLP
jgi:hypothetical protein